LHGGSEIHQGNVRRRHDMTSARLMPGARAAARAAPSAQAQGLRTVFAFHGRAPPRPRPTCGVWDTGGLKARRRGLQRSGRAAMTALDCA
jgi:hypothetical protein